MTARHFADSTNLDFCGQAPTDARISSIRDVLLVTTVGGGSFEEFQAHPPVDSPPIDLGKGVQLTEISPDESELVMNACAPRGHYFVAVRQFGIRNAFVRTISKSAYENSHYNWDADDVLKTVLRLSRLIRDNAYATQYAARIVEHADGQKQVIPYIGATSRYTWRIRQDRDWLDHADGLELHQLLKAYWSRQVPEPLHRSINLFEDSFGTPNLYRAVPLIAAGLEAFLNTSRFQSGAQFKSRVPQVAREFGLPAGKAFINRMWVMRSLAAHGQRIQLFTSNPTKPAQQQQQRRRRRTPSQEAVAHQVDRLREIQKAVLRKAINDVAYSTVLTKPAAVRRRWPATDDKGKRLNDRRGRPI
jgi:hypothetical protein